MKSFGFSGILKLFCFSLIVILASCHKKEGVEVPNYFNAMSVNDKMEYLMKELSPDSLAGFICAAALGEVENVNIDLQEAQLYAYEHYDENQIVEFVEGCKNFENTLPLHQKVKLVKLSATEDPEMYAYELGLSYVGDIREEKKTVDQVKDELEAFRRECKYDPDFYKRFMKGFKIALRNDRHKDLDDKIFITYINYPDSVK